VKIERAVLREVPLPLVRPFQSSAGLVTERHVLLLTIEGDGVVGWSECVAPDTPHYTYETSDTAWELLTGLVLPAAIGLEVSRPERVLAAAADVVGHPMAKATLEMAVWDMFARAREVSLSEMLGGTRAAVDVGVALGIMPVEELVAAIEGHLVDGYRRVKVKIAPSHDVEVIRTLRERFPDLVLWADANCAYRRKDAEHLRKLDPFGLGLLEEPLPAGDLLDSAELQQKIGTPICLDESIVREQQLATALELGSCSVVNLKPGRVGGLTTSLRMVDMLAQAELPVWCGGMLETGIGRAHNLALASLSAFTLPGDISASRRYWERDIVTPEFEVVDGKMAVPGGPGIGVEIDEERIEALTLRQASFG